jgi:hypothetical protein
MNALLIKNPGLNVSVSTLAVRTCVVCSRPLPGGYSAGRRSDQDLPICSSLPCLQVMSRRETMSAPACQQFLQNQARLLRQTRLLTLQRSHQARIEAAEDQVAALRLRAQLEIGAMQDNVEPIIPTDQRVTLDIGLPTGPLVTMPADPDRRAAFADHLRRVLSEAFESASAELLGATGESPSPLGLVQTLDSHEEVVHAVEEPSAADRDDAMQDMAQSAASTENEADNDTPYGPFSSQLCGVCAGGCCPVGSNHAFVTADTIRRVQSQGAARSAAELEALYLSYLPHESQEGGCIYQQAQGCALPREWRGDTCNTYICDSFRAVQEVEQESRIGARLPLQAVIVVQRRQNQWLRDKPVLDNGITGLAVVKADGKVLRFAAHAQANAGAASGQQANHQELLDGD